MSMEIAEYSVILTFVLTGILFLTLTFTLSKVLRPDRPDPDKLSTYECGEEAIGGGQIQFNSRFFVIALVFVLFEVEIIFFFPWSIVASQPSSITSTVPQWGIIVLAEMVVFVVILAIGLAYAWAHGHLDWIKPSTSPTQVVSKVPAHLYEKLIQEATAPKR